MLRGWQGSPPTVLVNRLTLGILCLAVHNCELCRVLCRKAGGVDLCRHQAGVHNPGSWVCTAQWATISTALWSRFGTSATAKQLESPAIWSTSTKVCCCNISVATCTSSCTGDLCLHCCFRMVLFCPYSAGMYGPALEVCYPGAWFSAACFANSTSQATGCAG